MILLPLRQLADVYGEDVSAKTGSQNFDQAVLMLTMHYILKDELKLIKALIDANRENNNSGHP